jgi:signal transduction histidine kinase
MNSEHSMAEESGRRSLRRSRLHLDLSIQLRLAVTVALIWAALTPITATFTYRIIYQRLFETEAHSLSEGRRTVASLLAMHRASVEEAVHRVANSQTFQSRLFSALYFPFTGGVRPGPVAAQPDIQAILREFQTERLSSGNLMVTDLLGHVFASVEGDISRAPMAVLSPSYLSDRLYSRWIRVDGEPCLLAVAPANDPDGEAIGFVAAIEPVNEDLLRWLQDNTGLEHAIARWDGTIEAITRGNLPSHLPVTPQGSGDVVEAGGFLFSVVAEPEANFLVLSAVPVDPLATSARIAARSAVAASSAVGVLPLLFMVAGGQRMLRPLSRLTQRMARYVGPGAPVARRDQVAAIEAGFTAMVEAIGQREAGLQEAAARLAAANRELASLDRLKTDLLANVSHELRTPLVSTRGYVEMVRDGKAGPVTDKQREYLAVALRNILNQARLIDELLDFTRLGEGNKALRLAVEDLRPILAQAAAVFRLEMEGKGLRFETSFGDAPLLARVDGRRLGQVLNNLLSNALKFTHQGDTVRLRAGRATDKAGVILISVEDTGIGIPPQELERIFARFHQVETGKARSYGGTGLGLAIARRIADLHGGTLTATSREGEGSTFTLRLPAAEG